MKYKYLFSVLLILFGIGLVNAWECDADLTIGDGANNNTCTVSSSLTLNGSYVVNMNGSTSGALQINADNIIFDCNGTTIYGNYTSGLIGIGDGLKNNVTIKNCTISNYLIALRVSGVSNFTFQDSKLLNFQYAYITGSNNTFFYRNNLTNFSSGGFYTDTPFNYYSVYVNNTFDSKNGVYGISHHLINGVDMQGNTFVDRGIACSNSYNCNISNTNFYNKQDSGESSTYSIYFSNSTGSIFNNDFANDSYSWTIYLEALSDADVFSNNFSNLSNYGINLRNGTYDYFLNNLQYVDKGVRVALNSWNTNVYNNTINLSVDNYDSYDLGVLFEFGVTNSSFHDNQVYNAGSWCGVFRQVVNVSIYNNYCGLLPRSQLSSYPTKDYGEPRGAWAIVELYKSWTGDGSNVEADNYVNKMSTYNSTNVNIYGNTYGSNVEVYFMNRGGISGITNTDINSLSTWFRSYRFTEWEDRTDLWINSAFNNLTSKLSDSSIGIALQQNFRNVNRANFTITKDYMYFKNVNRTNVTEIYNLTSALLTNGTSLCNGSSSNLALNTGQVNITLNPNDFCYVLDNYQLQEGRTLTGEPFSLSSSETTTTKIWNITSNITNLITIPINVSVECARIYNVKFTTNGVSTYTPTYNCLNNRLIISNGILNYSTSSNYLNVTYSWSNNTLWNGTDYNTIENLTFSTNQNITRWLRVPENSIIVNVSLNLSGYNSTNLLSNYTIENSSGWSYSGTNVSANPVENAVDGLWNTYAEVYTGVPDTLIIYENYTLHNNTGAININTKGAASAYNVIFYCYNYDTSSWLEIIRHGPAFGNNDLNSTSSLSQSCFKSSPLQIYGWSRGGSRIYETSIEIMNKTYPTNISLNIGNSQAWNYQGIFNQTNNRTSNLASYVNSYLDSCSFTGGYCDVPFIFHSDTGGILKYSDIIVTSGNVLENSQSYNLETYEGAVENFQINITYDAGYYNSISGVLNYDGTVYSGTLIGTGNNIILSANVTIPTYATLPRTNNFFWNITLVHSTTTSYLISNSYTQTVGKVTITLCNSTYNVSFINFTIKNAEYPDSVLNTMFKSTWRINSLINYSFQNISETNSSFAFCFFPSNRNYDVTATIEYQSTGYSKNYYYLTNATLSNQTMNISLYLLNSSKATLTTLKVYDDAQKNMENVYISIQAYNVGTDTYYTVAMAKTNYNGEDIAYLNWYDTLYRFALVKDNSVIKITSPFKISETPVIFEIPTTITFTYDKFRDIIYSLTFNNATNNFILTFIKPDGTVTSGCLRVVKKNPINDTQICDVCETSNSATLYCNIGGYGNGTFIATFYAQGSLMVIDSLTFVNAVFDIFEKIGNIDGTIYAFLMAGIVTALFFASPVLAVVGVIIGLIGAVAMGFQPINSFYFIGLVLVGGTVVWFLKR